MATYPLSTLSPTISSSGISSPSYNEIYQSLIASFQQIYGADVYLAPDSQDGQLITLFAKAIDDSNQATIATWNSYRITAAQGVGLSSLVKVSGITRRGATSSTAVGTVVGTPGITITQGVVRDTQGRLWKLPDTVIIPPGGSIVETVSAIDQGPQAAAAGSINVIHNPQVGWTSFVSTTDASPGRGVETDAELRTRQARSVELPAQSIIGSIYAAAMSVLGVTRGLIMENATGLTDSNGLPPHSFSLVLEGGSAQEIAQAIWSRKPPGAQSYGTTTIMVSDPVGLQAPINFFVVEYVRVFPYLVLTTSGAYSVTYGQSAISNLTSMIRGLGFGDDVAYTKAIAYASDLGGVGQGTFYVSELALGSSKFTGSISGTVLTVTSMDGGVISVGDSLWSDSVASGTAISSLGSGTGGVGTYNLSLSQTLASSTLIAAPADGKSNIVIPFNQVATADDVDVILVTL